jgi:hypothetical protein
MSTLEAIITTRTRLELGIGVVPIDARVESKMMMM